MIVVFGSINVDLVTSVAKHPRGGETVSGSDCIALPGGKGANQALSAKRAGANVRMIGAVGSDSFATVALKNLAADGIDLGVVHRTEGTTGIALIVIDANGENTIVVTPGANSGVKSSALSEQQYSVLLSQSEVAAEEVWQAHNHARKHDAVVIHNAAPATAIPEAALANIDYLIVNESEAVLVAKSLGTKESDPQEAGRLIQTKSQRTVVVTLGDAGAFATNGTDEFSIPSIAVDVEDTTGAGDAFVGAFAAAIDRGYGLEIAVRQGVVAGSLACRSVGAQSSMPSSTEIAAHLP